MLYFQEDINVTSTLPRALIKGQLIDIDVRTATHVTHEVAGDQVVHGGHQDQGHTVHLAGIVL